MAKTSENNRRCPVLEVCHLLGKKWMCPLIVNFEPKKCYSFEEIVKLSSRQINRTLLSNLLKDMIAFDLIINKENCYLLSKKGIGIKNVLEELKDVILVDYTEEQKNEFKDRCLVHSFKKR